MDFFSLSGNDEAILVSYNGFGYLLVWSLSFYFRDIKMSHCHRRVKMVDFAKHIQKN